MNLVDWKYCVFCYKIMLINTSLHEYVMKSAKITHTILCTIDERAPQNLRKRVFSYIQKGGDPRNLPHNLFLYFEPADESNFIAFREEKIEIGSHAQKKADPQTCHGKAKPLTPVLCDDRLNLADSAELKSKHNQVEEMLSSVGRYVFPQIIERRLLPENLETSISIIESLFRLHPKCVISLKTDFDQPLATHKFCSVFVHGNGNELKFFLILREFEVGFTVGRKEFFLGYEEFRANPVKALLRLEKTWKVMA